MLREAGCCAASVDHSDVVLCLSDYVGWPPSTGDG